MKKITISFLILVVSINLLFAQEFSSETLNKRRMFVNTTVVQDYDGDGDLDIIAIERDPDQLIWLENDETKQFPEHVIVDVDIVRPVDVDIADIDNDGDMDYVVCGASRINEKGELVWFQRQEDDTYIKWSIDVGKDFDEADSV